MTRWYVEHNESMWIEAESVEDAIQACRDGGGNAHTIEWFAEQASAWTLPLEPEESDDGG